MLANSTSKTARSFSESHMFPISALTRRLQPKFSLMHGTKKLAMRKPKEGPTCEITTSGLTTSDKENLMKRLNGLEQLASPSFLLGGADRMKVEDALKRIRLRMNPEQPSTLVKLADQILKVYVPSAPWVSDEVREEVMRAVG
jgi:hypothetical protein